MPYLSITDGRTARYDSSNNMEIKQIDGVYTDSFSSCNIVIFYWCANNNIKISMTHVDSSITSTHIKEELNWIGNVNNVTGYVIRRFDNVYSEEIKKRVLDNSPIAFKEHHCPEGESGVSINLQGKITFYSLTEAESLNLIAHPNVLLFSNVYKLNLLFNKYIKPTITLEHTRLIFDGIRWSSPLSKHDENLIESAKDLIEYFRANPLSQQDMRENVKAYIKGNPNLIELGYAEPMDKFLIADYAFDLIKNGFKKNEKAPNNTAPQSSFYPAPGRHNESKIPNRLPINTFSK